MAPETTNSILTNNSPTRESLLKISKNNVILENTIVAQTRQYQMQFEGEQYRRSQNKLPSYLSDTATNQSKRLI